MMPQTTVTLQYVNPPKPGKSWGSVKTPDGTRFAIPGAMISQVQQGGTYTFDYTEGANGFLGINTVFPAQEGAPVAPPQPAPAPMAPPPYQPPPQAPMAIQPQHAPSTGHFEDNKARDIFVTGVIGRAFHGTGQVPDGHTLAAMVRSCIDGWENGHKPAAPPAPAPEPYPNQSGPYDTIPF